MPERKQTDFITGYDRLTASSPGITSGNAFHSPNFSNRNIQKLIFDFAKTSTSDYLIGYCGIAAIRRARIRPARADFSRIGTVSHIAQHIRRQIGIAPCGMVRSCVAARRTPAHAMLTARGCAPGDSVRLAGRRAEPRERVVWPPSTHYPA
ncbi:hypothetical protein [Burkholderia singularis]|uniref:hypothetical protein n=1 Tax=Burkholderia singularis TaxID=1503053 RepID=UPI00117CAE00|nr:hypothetical protein [Burkholderia singularis]